MKIIKKLFGTHSERELKKINVILKQIELYDEKMANLTDVELQQKTPEFKERLNQGETLDDILPEAYAVCREASKRVLNMKHFPVQLIGGIVLHNGRIAEMRTGEGKTLVATLPVYLNALAGKGVHVVTVNDYLAKRDAEQMGQLYEWLGLTTGCVINGLSPYERQQAYRCDITYGTNNEFGFDYLRDNMVTHESQRVQRGLHYAVIDEVDSVLIDEARTPLIISGQGAKSTALYSQADMFVRRLKKGEVLGKETAMSTLMREELEETGDYIVDEKQKSVTLTADGVRKAEVFFGLENLSDPDNIEIQHHITIALKAHSTMHKEKDYIINNQGEIIIVDEFTGRLMEGRRYSDGLHQAIEAKEGVEIKKESKTLATITFQSYFNKYKKKAGMTGTAQTEEAEFRETYGMDVIIIPTNRPIQRIDHPDQMYKSLAAKYKAVIRDIKESVAKRQPVLVGTVNIDTSEHLSHLLRKEGIHHQVLNAKYHEQEAEIVADAGRLGAVTIATNMAGRGTDIKLEDGVEEVGGLKIIGTERHETRRIDNQLRGRAGRQGDKGESRFYLSLEDDLMRLFMPESTLNMLNQMNLPEDEPIAHSILTSAIERAQKKVEGNNFGIRKHLLQYDMVMTEQRDTLYKERDKVLVQEMVTDMIEEMANKIVQRNVEFECANIKHPEEWDLKALSEKINNVIPIGLIEISKEDIVEYTLDRLGEFVKDRVKTILEAKKNEIGEDRYVEACRTILLRVIDQKWTDHLDSMEQLKQGINLQAYGQRDPLVEYKFQSFDLFDEMSCNIQEDTLRAICSLKIIEKPKVEIEVGNTPDGFKTKIEAE